MKTYAIGDIHGCLHTLLALINKLPLERQDKLIFLGDYIDRGDHSKQVVDYVKSMTESGQAIALMGNHERMCIDANGGSGYWQQIWTKNGGYDAILLPLVKYFGRLSLSKAGSTSREFLELC